MTGIRLVTTAYIRSPPQRKVRPILSHSRSKRFWALHRHDLSLLLVVLIWGFNFPILKLVLSRMDLHVLNMFRLWIAAATLAIIHVRFQQRTSQSFFGPLRLHFRSLLVCGLIGFLLYQFFFIEGINNTSAGSAALILASAPFWAAASAHVLRIEHLKTREWSSLSLTIAGAVVVVLGGSSAIMLGYESLVGNLSMMAAAVCWGSFTTVSKPLTRQVNPSGVAVLGLLLALPFLTALGLPRLAEVDWSVIGAWEWLAIMYSGSLSIGLTIAIWTTAVKKVGPSHTAIYGNVVPLIALLVSCLLLGDRITWFQIVGGAMIVGGVYFMRRTRVSR